MQRVRSSDHIRRNRLTTILGNAELLQRWVERTTSLSERERTMVAQQVVDILQAAQDLRNDQYPPQRSTDES